MLLKPYSKTEICSKWQNLLNKTIESLQTNKDYFFINLYFPMFLWVPKLCIVVTFFEHKIFFCAASSCSCQHEIIFFVQHQLFLLTWNTFSCNTNLFLSTPEYLFCNNFFFHRKLFFMQHQIFVLDIICFVMVIYFYCHVATKK